MATAGLRGPASRTLQLLKHVAPRLTPLPQFVTPPAEEARKFAHSKHGRRCGICDAKIDRTETSAEAVQPLVFKFDYEEGVVEVKKWSVLCEKCLGVRDVKGLAALSGRAVAAGRLAAVRGAEALPTLAGAVAEKHETGSQIQEKFDHFMKINEGQDPINFQLAINTAVAWGVIISQGRWRLSDASVELLRGK